MTKKQRRGPAIVGAVAGVAVVAALIGILAVRHGDDSDQSAQPKANAADAAAGPLGKEPVVGGGTGKLTKLVVTPLIAGTGAPVQKGQTVTVNYVLVSYTTGQQIEASWDSGGPVPLVVGAGRLIRGWDIGLPGQRVGSRVRLDVPAGLAYGPAKGDLRFVVDILNAQ